MAYLSLSGIDNNKYSLEFINWLFEGLTENKIKRVLQVGLDNGYLSSLLLARTFFSDFQYLGIGNVMGLQIPMQFDRENFFLTDDIMRVEAFTRAAYFIVSGGPCVMVVEDMQGPLFYWPLLKPQDVMITYGTVPDAESVVPDWYYKTK